MSASTIRFIFLLFIYIFFFLQGLEQVKAFSAEGIPLTAVITDHQRVTLSLSLCLFSPSLSLSLSRKVLLLNCLKSFFLSPFSQVPTGKSTSSAAMEYTYPPHHTIPLLLLLRERDCRLLMLTCVPVVFNFVPVRGHHLTRVMLGTLDQVVMLLSMKVKVV